MNRVFLRDMNWISRLYNPPIDSNFLKSACCNFILSNQINLKTKRQVGSMRLKHIIYYFFLFYKSSQECRTIGKYMELVLLHHQKLVTYVMLISWSHHINLTNLFRKRILLDTALSVSIFANPPSNIAANAKRGHTVRNSVNHQIGPSKAPGNVTRIGANFMKVSEKKMSIGKLYQFQRKDLESLPKDSFQPDLRSL